MQNKLVLTCKIWYLHVHIMYMILWIKAITITFMKLVYIRIFCIFIHNAIKRQYIRIIRSAA